MTNPSLPEIVTTPTGAFSPSPLYRSPPTSVPSPRQCADTVDVASPDRVPSAIPDLTSICNSGANMPANADPSNISDTIVVGGYDEAESQEESIIDDASSDVYGEDEAAQEPKNESEAGNDDYARTFDSPAQEGGEAKTETEPDEARGDVSKARESITNSSASDFLKSQSPVVAAPRSADPSTPDLSHSDGSTLEPPASAEPAPASEDSPYSDEASARETTPLQPSEQVIGQGSRASPADDAVAVIDDVDIQRLVDDITARAAAPAQGQPAVSSPPSYQTTPNAFSVSQPASLPPKPSLPQQSGPPGQHVDSYRPPPSAIPNPHASPALAIPTQGHGAAPPAQTPSYLAAGAGAPGTTSDVFSNLPPPPSSAFNPVVPQSFRPVSQQHTSGPSSASAEKTHGHQAQQAYEQFLADERRYMSEAKWERFPEGSRIFVGNLSAEKVSKRDVFEVFHRYGRLAQISLKSAFGFVQYHTVEDAEAAMKGLQGAVIKGRKLNLEYSRTQKKDKDRERSPDRGRGKGSGRNVDRYDGRDQGRRGRDDYRPGRSPSPRRDDFYARGHYEAFDRSRGRSRSPQRHARHDSDPYRRRTPSPYRRSQPEPDQLDIPRRYGSDVPDVQLLLLQEVQRDFVSWIQKAFYDRGLKSDVMFLNPRFPRDAVIQRQVLEGVHGVVELDLRSQGVGKIPLQVFDRSAGINNVRYDQYQDLDPKIAAELVLRTKSQAAQQQIYPTTSYPPQYPPPAQQTAYPYSGAAPGGGPHQPPPVSAPDIAGVIGQIDNSTLQKLLASLQANQSGTVGPAQSALQGVMPGLPQAGAPAASTAAAVQNSPIDINALLGNLKNVAGVSVAGPGQAAHPSGYVSNPYTAANILSPPSGSGVGAGMAGGTDASQQVQNIMATLAKFRQQ